MFSPTLLCTLAPLISGTPGDPELPAWGGFRGSDGSGVASGARIPASFDPESNLLWRTEIESGYSSPIVHDGRVYLTASEDKQLLTMAVDVVSGAVLWKQSTDFDGSRIGANSPCRPDAGDRWRADLRLLSPRGRDRLRPRGQGMLAQSRRSAL